MGYMLIKIKCKENNLELMRLVGPKVPITFVKLTIGSYSQGVAYTPCVH